MSEYTIDEVINFADENGICKKDDKFNTFRERNEYLFNRVKQRAYRAKSSMKGYFQDGLDREVSIIIGQFKIKWQVFRLTYHPKNLPFFML